MAWGFLISAVVFAIAAKFPAPIGNLEMELKGTWPRPPAAASAVDLLDERFGFSFSKKPQAHSWIADSKVFRLAAARPMSKKTGRVKKGSEASPPTSYWLGCGGVWWPLPVYGRGLEAGVMWLSGLETKATKYYNRGFPKLRKRLEKPGGWRKELRKHSPADLLTAIYAGTTLLVLLLGAIGFDRSVNRYLVVGVGTLSPLSLTMSSYIHFGLVELAVSVYTVRQTADSLAKKLSAEEVLIAHLGCSVAAASLFAVWTRFRRAVSARRLAAWEARGGSGEKPRRYFSTIYSGGLSANVGLLLLESVLRPSNTYMFFRFGPLHPVYMALVLVLADTMLGQSASKLPGHVGAALAGFGLAAYYWPANGVAASLAAVMQGLEQLPI